MNNPKGNRIIEKAVMNRRDFVQQSGTAVATLSLLSPKTLFAAEANSKIRLGMIGCGGRGKWIAKHFMNHGGYELVAAADYFQDRVDEFGTKFEVPEAKRFTGLSAYKRLLDSGVDAIAIESPPYFHPEQAAAGVDAGVHVYLAKPIAVDVPGCQTIADSGAKATQNKLVYLIDFQTRAQPIYMEAVKRVHQGDIGPIASGVASYHCGRLGTQAEPGTPEARLRNWVFDIALSGDIITEQNIHAIDVATWVLDSAPVSSIMTGGRKVRTDVGDCWDHFVGLFKFPNDTLISFSSKQYGKGFDDILCRMYGSEGTIDTHYGGLVTITGEKPYEGGDTKSIYGDGAIANIATFHDSIHKKDFSNPTVAPSVRSNLSTLLGRMAAYQGREVTWEEMMKSEEKLDGKLEGLKS